MATGRPLAAAGARRARRGCGAAALALAVLAAPACSSDTKLAPAVQAAYDRLETDPLWLAAPPGYVELEVVAAACPATDDGDGRETRFPSRRLETPTPRRWRHPISYYRDRAEAQGWTVGPLERGGVAGDQPDRLDLELTKEVEGHVQHLRVGVRRTGDRGLLFLDGAIDDLELCPAD
ncbi:MAG: hypothetical protein KF703_13095 [Actinobacteria bacterium]|nr:hypothetical protein [Actinomycetota bacterium]